MKQIILYILLLPTILLSAPDKLNGTYKVGGSGSDFATIADAVDSLYLAGINGPVTFLLGLNSYNEQIDLNGAISGSSSTNTVTFESQGNPNNVEIHYSATSSTDNFVIRINSARHIIFNDITFTADGSNYARIVYSETPVGDITFNGNIFNGASANGVDANKYLIYCYANNSSENLDNYSFVNNEFNNGSYALYLYSYVTSKSTGLVIDNNNFNTNSSCILIQNFISPSITSNISSGSGTDYAFQLIQCDNNFKIEKNKISSPTLKGRGINFVSCNISGSSYGNITNNFIQVHNEGIILTNSDKIEIYFNNVVVDHSVSGVDNSSFVLKINSGNTNIFTYNNIFDNRRTGYAIIGETENTNFSDNNNLYTNGTNIAKWDNINYTTLSSFSTASSSNSHSYNEAVTYASLTDLHIQSTPTFLYGTTIAGIDKDIDGDLRAIPPFIGADEISQLFGTYLIGSGGDYTTITDAVNDLYSKGIAGAVTFKIKNGAYNEQINLNGTISGSSSTNTVTFESNSGNAADVDVTYSATGTVDNYVLRINEAEHVKIKNLTFTAGGTDFAIVVSLENVAGNLEFFSNIMNGYEVTSGGAYLDQSVIICNSGKLDNTTFENNVINQGYNGLYLDLTPTSFKSLNLQIIGNIINSRYKNILIYYADAPMVSSNICSNLFSYSINLNNCSNDLIIEKNELNGSYGIQILSCHGSPGIYGIIKNNVIISSNNGIDLRSSSYTRIYFNTVKNTGSFSNSAPLRVLETSTGLTNNIIVKNNIFYSSGTGYSILWDDGTISECNYNNLYTTGTTLVKHGSTDYATLTDWQAAPEGFDADSYSEDVTFASDTDLHIVSTPVQLNGTTIAGITTDIDGETRGTPPFIGADEPNGIYVSVKVFLEGPYNSPVMNASLTLPLTSPYSVDPETVNSIPAISGNEVVDWVLLELRDENNSSAVLESQSAFILQDGSIVDLSGSSPVHFTLPNGNYFIAVKHRNHLGVMSANAVGF